MARKASINLENLAVLGVEKLARLVLDESERDAGFRKLVSAALAGKKGPKAVAALVDRRIAALERARSFIEWDRAKTFGADLDMTVKTIVDELGPADPTTAVERLLRFIATHETVFERVDDSRGGIQDVYETAIAALKPIAAAMPQAERARLPELVTAALGEETYGYFPITVAAVIDAVPASALSRWDKELAARQAALSRDKAGPRDWMHGAPISGIIACRQSFAQARGDLDGFIALEETKHPNLRNSLDIAERLLAAGRAREALGWVRRESGQRIGFMTHADLADGVAVRDLSSNRRVGLEARILENLGDRPAARDLRWNSFKTTLDATMLREHIAHLEEFAEFEVMDQALDHVSSASSSYRALKFLIEWPKLDRAASLVVERRAQWDGRHYDVLVGAADALEHAHPAAATILYRALLNDILARAKSPAYGHGARYLARLDDLAAVSDSAAITELETHATYRAGLMKTHGRKSGFWAMVAGKRGAR